MEAPVVVQPEYMSYDEARRYCGLSRQQIWREIRDGRIAAYKAGRRVLIERRSLDEFIRSRPVVETKAPDA